MNALKADSIIFSSPTATVAYFSLQNKIKSENKREKFLSSLSPFVFCDEISKFLIYIFSSFENLPINERNRLQQRFNNFIKDFPTKT